MRLRYFAFSLLAIHLAHATAIYSANNGDTISATISATELTRIEVEGQKIIKDYSSADVSKKITQPLGQVYLIPNTYKHFNLYVTSDTGNTYNLDLTPSSKVSGDSIIIKSASIKKPTSKFNFNTSEYVRNLNYLLEIMYLKKQDDNLYTYINLNQSILTYQGLDSVFLGKYTSDHLIGSVFLLKNISKSKILLTEAEFYTPHTLAVAIENPSLPVNEFTRVFLIQEVKVD